ncbi:MAG TPA: hypothetical protein VJR89_02010 [Polyangiales bacterium]|nr:hypothetical protein [Polyangiales bacterium]
MRPAAALACVLVCSACGFGHEVEQDGRYAVTPGTRVDDSAVYPLDQLLIVEQDLRVGQTRLYYFRGDIHAADLGLEDLRRIALRHGGFQMAFDEARDWIDASELEGHGKPQHALVGDERIELVRLDDEGLRETGAARYLTGVSSGDYDVRAYFGAIDREGPLPRIEIEGSELSFEPQLPSPQLGVDSAQRRLTLDYSVNADYLLVELAQLIHSDDGKRDVDALVRTALAPGSAYVVSPALLTDVAGQGCWARDRSLELRLHQVVRAYAASGQAVIHERIDVHELAPEVWTALLEEPHPASYCEDFK